MDKKIVLIGVALLIIAIILFFVSGYLSTSGVKNNVRVSNVTVKPDGYTYLPVSYKSNLSVLAIYALLSGPTNFYLLNASTFSKWSQYMNSNSSANGYNYINKLGVNKAYLQTNVSVTVLPLDVKDPTVNGYFQQLIYVVVDNTHGSKSVSSPINASLSYLPLANSNVLAFAALGYGVVLLGLAGIVIIVWGALRKPKVVATPATAKSSKISTKEQQQKEYVDRLYKGVKDKKKKSSDDSD